MDRIEFPPIPIWNDELDTRGYHGIEFDDTDPRGSEPLVDVGSHGIAVVPYYHLSDGSNPPYGRQIKGSLARTWCRAGIVPMLQAANAALAENGCELVVYDAYRTISTQRDLWSWAVGKAAEDYPELSQPELEARTRQYCSDPRHFDAENETTWPTHSTGASVDVVLRSLRTGEELDMGAAFDDLSAISHTDYLEREQRAGRIEPDNTALLNRRLLYWVMRKVGFTNYPSEYWHFDYGNQMYMFNKQSESGTQCFAWYGYHAVPQ